LGRCGGVGFFQEERSLTVDGNGNGLGQDVAIGADKDGNLGQRVELEELGSRVDGVDNDSLDVQTVGLRNSEDGRGAGVALQRRVGLANCLPAEKRR
jgi:hypothetical protein